MNMRNMLDSGLNEMVMELLLESHGTEVTISHHVKLLNFSEP